MEPDLSTEDRAAVETLRREPGWTDLYFVERYERCYLAGMARGAAIGRAEAIADAARLAGVLRSVVESGSALKHMTIGPHGQGRRGEFNTVLELAKSALALHDELTDAAAIRAV